MLRLLKLILAGALALVLLALGALWIGASMSLDRSYSHTAASGALPAFQEGGRSRLVQIAANGYSFRARIAGFDNPNPKGDLLLLHGFPETSIMYEPLIAAASEAGYRVVAFDQRGYSPGARPEGRSSYGGEQLVADALAVADAVGFDRFHLVGHDWGAGVTYVAGAIAPERFHSLATLAVPHSARLIEGMRAVPAQLLKSWYMMFFQLRGIAELAVERNDWALIRKLWKDWSPDFELPEEEWAELRATFAAAGVKRAMLGYYRQNVSPAIMLGLKKTEATRLTTVPVRTLAITGADDGCMDTRLYDHVFSAEDFPNGFRVERIQGAGHFTHQEKPEEVNRLLLDWLTEG
jgi:pimeloyl-ACP methyl ester carboxylesterase